MKYPFIFNSKKQQLFLAVILVHCLFFITKIFLSNYFLADSYEYYHLAENIKNSFEFYSADIQSTIQFENYTKRPPLYGLFILVFSFFLHSTIAVIIFQNIISIISIFLCLRLFEYYYKTINYKIYFILLLSSVSQFIYTNYLMSELLFQFLIVLLCYFFHQIVTKKTLVQLVYFQIVIVLLFLTKPIFYLFIVPNIFVSIYFTKFIKKAYLSSLIPILVCALYLNWNHQRTGSFEFSSIQNINLKNYNLYYFNLNKYGELYAKEVDEKITAVANTKSSYPEIQNEIKTQSISYIKKDLLSYSIMHLKGSFRMFLDPGRFDLYNFFEFKNKEKVGFLKHLNENRLLGALEFFKMQPVLIILIIPLLLLFNSIKIIGFILFWLKSYKTTPALLWFMLFIIIYFTALTGLIGSSRFLIPILPFYIFFSTLGLSKNRHTNEKSYSHWSWSSGT